jgi:hypothetical protein
LLSALSYITKKTLTTFENFMVSYGANSGVAISYDSLKKTVPSLLDVESEDKSMLMLAPPTTKIRQWKRTMFSVHLQAVIM